MAAGMGNLFGSGGRWVDFSRETVTRKKKKEAFLAFLRVLRSKTGKNHPGAALEHLKVAKMWALEPEKLISPNGAEKGGGAAELFSAAGVSKQRHFRHGSMPRHAGWRPPGAVASLL